MRKQERHEPLGAEVRAIVQQAYKGGWTISRIAAGMRERGHAGWNESVVRRVLDDDRAIQVDEAVNLLAMIKGSNQLLIARIDKVTAEIAATGRRRA